MESEVYWEEFLKLYVRALQSWVTTILDGDSQQEGKPSWPWDSLVKAKIPSDNNTETRS